MPFEKGHNLGKGRPYGSKNRKIVSKSEQVFMDLISSFKTGSYYVYYHLLDGEVVYIGKGKSNRAWNFTTRTEKWIEVCQNKDIEVVIKIADLTENQALEIESILIKSIKPICNIQLLF